MSAESIIRLAPPRSEDAAALLAFELENRAFFEARINARPASYYTLAGVYAAIEEAMRDEAADKAYQHVVRDAAGVLVGRVNLTRVRRAHFHVAELGYRIGEAACGKGYASAAVGQVVARAFKELQLVRLEAVTRPENIASRRVLVRNGFIEFGRSRQSFELAGVWYDTIHFERRRDD
jgi:ribosomal-protein-alanine N-acetyltransferase